MDEKRVEFMKGFILGHISQRGYIDEEGMVIDFPGFASFIEAEQAAFELGFKVEFDASKGLDSLTIYK